MTWPSTGNQLRLSHLTYFLPRWLGTLLTKPIFEGL